MSDERRRFPRFAVHLQVTLASGTQLQMASENISLGGLFLVCEESPCTQGERVEVELRLPTNGEPDSVSVPCTVMHVVPPLGIGLRFEIDGSDNAIVRDRLQQYLDRLAKVQAELA